MNIIEIANATVYRGSTVALSNFNLTLPANQHHAILGGNGAGKSSFLKLITRELHPVVNDELKYLVFGEERPLIWNLREKIGIVSQDFQDSYLSLAAGIEVVISGLLGSVGIHMHHEVTDEQRTTARSMMNELGIEYLADKPYLQLSPGQQRRLILARALVHKPEVLILDEPTNGLDLQAKFWFLNAIQSLARSGTTIVMVTHDPLEVIPEIKNITLLKRGNILFTGEKHEAFTERKLSETYDVELRINEHNGFYHLSPNNG